MARNHFTKRIKTTAPGPATVKPEPARTSFLRWYRTELIAAVLLLLIGFGSRQVYLQLKHNENNRITAVKTPDSEMILEEKAILI